MANGYRLMIMTYDEKIKKAEEIIEGLEKTEALSMDEYHRRASEASALLKECKDELEAGIPHVS